jgi:hypothetical protein
MVPIASTSLLAALRQECRSILMFAAGVVKSRDPGWSRRPARLHGSPPCARRCAAVESPTSAGEPGHALLSERRLRGYHLAGMGEILETRADHLSARAQLFLPLDHRVAPP